MLNRSFEDGAALRLNLQLALDILGEQSVYWEEKGKRVEGNPLTLGDVVLARKDIKTSYHLSVVVDDALQGVTDIIRGEDLYHVTPVQRILQDLLGYHVPRYHHHPLLCDEKTGRRLSKSEQAVALRNIRHFD
jgi:glutamyl-Q tRNA(Asp) synthetase